MFDCFFLIPDQVHIFLEKQTKYYPCYFHNIFSYVVNLLHCFQPIMIDLYCVCFRDLFGILKQGKAVLKKTDMCTLHFSEN